MTAPFEENKRRSSRVFIKLPVVLRGKNADGRTFRETSETIVVNAHGALLYLQAPVAMEAILVLINPTTQEEQECRVVYLGGASEKGTRLEMKIHLQAKEIFGETRHPGQGDKRDNPGAY